MKFTFSWLKDYLDTSLSAQEISTYLTKIGLVVEELTTPIDDQDKFIIVKVKSVRPHPQADRLTICEVTDNTRSLQVVCGAANVHENMISVLALPTAKIPQSGIKIKESTIRGEKSFGMLCSPAELNETEDSKGIIDLPSDACVGRNYFEEYGTNDIIFNVEVTNNRGDCLGVYGIARDLSAAGAGKLKELEKYNISEVFTSSLRNQNKLNLEEKKFCPLFFGYSIEGVKNVESPEWLKNRLISVGLQPVSSLVDITNYLCLDLARPMHAFDQDKISGILTLRMSESGESFVALDGEEYKLNSECVVISDDKQVLSVPGVMGGLYSGCSEDTVNIFLESALFTPDCIMKAGRYLNIHSESRFRFERGVDPSLVEYGLKKAAFLIQKICGGKVSKKTYISKQDFKQQKIKFEHSFIKRLSGIDIKQQEVNDILVSLGFSLAQNEENIWNVPSWRRDIKEKNDFVEEVLRIKGYDAIHIENNSIKEHSSLYSQNILWIIRNILIQKGYYELITWSFVNEKMAKLFGGVNSDLIIENPIHKDFNIVRSSLLPQLLLTMKKNQDFGKTDMSIFEIGNVCFGQEAKDQKKMISGLRVGKDMGRHWVQSSNSFDFYDVKSDVIEIFRGSGFDINNFKISKEVPSWFHPGRSATFSMGRPIAVFGELHPYVLNQLQIKERVFGFEVYFSDLRIKQKTRKPKPLCLSPFPSMTRDFAFVLDKSIDSQDIITTIKLVSSDLIQNISVFDQYIGENIDNGKKSLAFEVNFVSSDRTLCEEDIKPLCEKIVNIVKENFNGTLRS